MRVSSKVLLVAPEFHNYYKEIILSFNRKGYDVDFFPEDISSLLYRIIKHLSAFYVSYQKEKYLRHLLASIDYDAYEIVLVIRGGILTLESLEALRAKLPRAKFVMYQWDSNEQSDYKNKINYFDVVKTFDLLDAEKFGIGYQSLFYSRVNKDPSRLKKDKCFDLVFFGAFHSDRLDVIKKIDRICSQNGLTFRHHLFITKLSFIKNLFLGFIKLSDLKYLKLHKCDKSDIFKCYSVARSTLDIELNIQTGITMRTFEALGFGIKVVTTNPYVAKDPIYSDQNVCIIDRDSPAIPLDFITSDFEKNLIY